MDDVTDQERPKAALHRRATRRRAESDILQRVAKTLSETEEPLVALAAVTEDVASVFRASMAAAVVLGEGVDGRHLVLSDPELGADAERLFLEQMRDSDGWLARLRQAGFRLLTNNLEPSRLPEGWGHRLRADQMARLLVVPFFVRGVTLGGLVISRGREDYPFDEGDVWLAQSIGDVLALSIGVSVHSSEMNQFFAASLELLCMIDFGGHLHRLNPQWEQVLGYDPQELEGAPFLDLVHPDDRPTTAAALGDLSEARVPVQFVNRFRARDGSYRSMEWLARPGADLVYASARDITERLAQERALRESETRLQDLVLTTGDWIWEIDRGGRYTAAWGNVQDVIGYEPEEVIGHTPLDFMSPEEAGRIAPILAQMAERREGCGALVRRSLHKDGREVLLMTACVPIFDADGEYAGLRGVDKDVTLRERLGRALQESEDRYRLIAENTNDVIVLLDLDSMTFEYVSPSMERLTGFTPDDLIGQDLGTLLPSEARERAWASTKKSQAATDAGDSEARYYITEAEFMRKDGGTVPVELSVKVFTDEEGRARKHVSLCRDITSRKEAETALRESEERYRLIADNVADVIWVLELASMDFSYISPSVERLRGFTPDEVLAQSIQDVLTPDSYQKVLDLMGDVLARAAAGEAAIVESLEIEQPRKGGGTVEAEIITRVLLGPDGRPAQILGVSRDLSERKAAETGPAGKPQASRRPHVRRGRLALGGRCGVPVHAVFRRGARRAGLRARGGPREDAHGLHAARGRRGDAPVRVRAGGQERGLLRGRQSQPSP